MPGAWKGNVLKTESSYTSDVLRHVRQLRPEAIVYKVNDRTTGGIPDVYLGLNGESLWVEFKRSVSARPNINTLLTPLQKRTLEKMRNTNIYTLVLVRTPARWEVFSEHGFISFNYFVISFYH